MNIFSLALTPPSFSPRSLYCSSFPYFHGFMILYVFSASTFFSPVIVVQQKFSIVGLLSMTSFPALFTLFIYAERKENGKNSIFCFVIIRYNQITSDTRERKIYSRTEIWRNDDDFLVFPISFRKQDSQQIKRWRWQKDTDELSSTTKTISLCCFCSVISWGFSCFAFHTLFPCYSKKLDYVFHTIRFSTFFPVPHSRLELGKIWIPFSEKAIAM